MGAQFFLKIIASVAGVLVLVYVAIEMGGWKDSWVNSEANLLAVIPINKEDAGIVDSVVLDTNALKLKPELKKEVLEIPKQESVSNNSVSLPAVSIVEPSVVESQPSVPEENSQPQLPQEQPPSNLQPPTSQAQEPVSPTPPLEPEPVPTASASLKNIVISEIRAGTDENGAEDEFVELYNPNDQPINLVSWSLKKKSSTGSESNLVSAAAFSGIIAPKSFFLIAHINYKGASLADLIYFANSNNLSYTNNSALLYDANKNLVDEASWTEVPKDQSIERRAYLNSCVSAQGSGEDFGNGCDTDSALDFEWRAIPNPQNTQSLPEPR